MSSSWHKHTDAIDFREPNPPEVTDYRIAGDRATAKSGDYVLDCVRIDGRWYSVPPPIPKISKPRKSP